MYVFRAYTPTTNQYDALNRITSKSYNDGATPTASFAYDKCPTAGCPSGYPSTPNTVGRLVESSVSNAATFESYDPIGRTAGEWQCTPENCGTSYFSLAYTYDLFGDILSSSNGASVTLHYLYNSLAQPITLTSSVNDSNHPGTLFSNPTYNAPGLLTADKLGNGISETRAYNSRLRATSIADGTAYNVAITYAPNGDVITANDSVNGSWSYGTNSNGLNGYDDFNRLLLATSGSSTYSYLYDRVGNRWEQLLNGSCTAGTASCLTFDANNHESNGLLSYDAAGNVISDSMHFYSYDAENRLINVDSGTTATYIYDANGRRVRKTNAGINYDYLYDLGGHVVSVYAGGWDREEVYLGNRHLATYVNGTTYFAHADWLGTERARTTVAGAIYETCTSLPFGDNLHCSTTDPNSPIHFTGKEHDAESGLDNFGARYNSSSFGRFMSSDPGGVGSSEKNPQSWNAYTYVGNNPLNAVDPDGQDYYLIGGKACGDTVQCDKEGFVLDDTGNRQVVTDEQINGSNGLAKIDENGNLQINTAQGTFQGLFFDPNPASITVTLSPQDRSLLIFQMAGELAESELKQDALIMAAGAADAAALSALSVLGKSATASEAFGPSTVGAAQAPLTRELMRDSGMSAAEAIAKYKKGGINRVFPGQYRNATLQQIEKAAQAGDRAARSALKLLFSSEYNKP